ncbi:helix-turn-helix domain-containing protein, partial [Amycolatopsis dongchuanensis]|uniref:helix-turn-helix domain-containing protein n=1 Tax=Amycolatopsis dongchuanensis TaxID=1070866 RepID=UPI0031FA0F08
HYWRPAGSGRNYTLDREEPENSSLSTDERKILEVLTESEQGMNCREVADQSGMSLAETYRLLSALHNKKLTTKTTVENESGLRVLLHAASPTGQ